MAAMAADVEDFDVEIDLPRFLYSVLEKAESTRIDSDLVGETTSM